MTDDRTTELATRIVLWIIFSVIIGLLPFFTKFQQMYLRNVPTDLQAIFADGSLFVVSSIVAASAVGELVVNLIRHDGSPRLISIGVTITIGMTLIIIYIGGSSFADITINGEIIDKAAIALSRKRVTEMSLTLFGFSVVSGLGCLFISEVCKWKRT